MSVSFSSYTSANKYVFDQSLRQIVKRSCYELSSSPFAIDNRMCSFFNWSKPSIIIGRGVVPPRAVGIFFTRLRLVMAYVSPHTVKRVVGTGYFVNNRKSLVCATFNLGQQTIALNGFVFFRNLIFYEAKQIYFRMLHCIQRMYIFFVQFFLSPPSFFIELCDFVAQQAC